MLKIDLLTIITAPIRNLYLERLFSSLERYSDDNRINKHILIFNGVEQTDEYNQLSDDKLKLCFSKDKLSVGKVLNTFKGEIESELVMKIDDDAEILSNKFFDHLFAIYEKNPGSVISPYPVGLINNPGGVPSNNRSVIFSEVTNTYYTLRHVNHVGGFARISPTYIYHCVDFSDGHNEDGEFSSFCNKNNIPMFYLENNLVVQHQESSLGQHSRYGKEYFGDRF